MFLKEKGRFKVWASVGAAVILFAVGTCVYAFAGNENEEDLLESEIEMVTADLEQEILEDESASKNSSETLTVLDTVPEEEEEEAPAGMSDAVSGSIRTAAEPEDKTEKPVSADKPETQTKQEEPVQAQPEAQEPVINTSDNTDTRAEEIKEAEEPEQKKDQEELKEEQKEEELKEEEPEEEQEEEREKEPVKSDLDSGSGVSRPAVFPNGVAELGDDSDLILDDEKVEEILANLGTEVSAERLAVVMAAYSLEDQINYFWGGKSNAIGWDTHWRNQAYVTSAGSKSTGTVRSYGLDCSGFVNWVFNNAAGVDVSEYIGNGTTNQWRKSEDVAIEDAKPGDLAFFAKPGQRSINHVGVVVGITEEGELIVAHCSSGQNTVVIDTGNSGFKYIVRPDIYEESMFLEQVVYNLFPSKGADEVTESE